MTQVSRIQAGNKNATPLRIDSGPYTAREWADLYATLFEDGPQTAPAIIPRMGNLLAVTTPAAGKIRVDTGMALCDGRFFSNSAAVDFTIPAPVGNPRIDRVVLLQNNTALPVTAGIATPNSLIFPTVLSDYNGLPSVPADTGRLAILRGTPAASPVVPTLDLSSTTLFMKPLARYQISTAGVISNLTKDAEMTRSPLTGMHWLDGRVLAADSHIISITDLPQTYSAYKLIGGVQLSSPSAPITLSLRLDTAGGTGHAYVASRMSGFDLATVYSASTGTAGWPLLIDVTPIGNTFLGLISVEIVRHAANDFMTVQAVCTYPSLKGATTDMVMCHTGGTVDIGTMEELTLYTAASGGGDVMESGTYFDVYGML